MAELASSGRYCWNVGVCCVCCGVLQHAAVCCSAIHCLAVCCSVLQCVAVWYSVLQYDSVCCCSTQCTWVCSGHLTCGPAMLPPALMSQVSCHSYISHQLNNSRTPHELNDSYICHELNESSFQLHSYHKSAVTHIRPANSMTHIYLTNSITYVYVTNSMRLFPTCTHVTSQLSLIYIPPTQWHSHAPPEFNDSYVCHELDESSLHLHSSRMWAVNETDLIDLIRDIKTRLTQIWHDTFMHTPRTQWVVSSSRTLGVISQPWETYARRPTHLWHDVFMSCIDICSMMYLSRAQRRFTHS